MVERALHPCRIPITEASRALVAEAINQLQNYEHHFELRRRRRRPADQEIFERTITAVLSDAICWNLVDPEGWLFLGLSHRNLTRRSRYSPFSFGRKLSHNLNVMAAEEMAFIEMRLGQRVRMIGPDGEESVESRQTTIKAAPRLRRWIDEYRVGLGDFSHDENEEVIILKASREWHGDGGNWIEYEDTEQTNSWREGLRAINRWLKEGDIQYVGGLRQIDASNRRLRRYFNNGRWDEGGRLMGGFWQNMQKAERRHQIRINGERTTELDYGQMALRTLYGIEGTEPPQGDLYAIPGFEEYRDGLKLVINSALFVDERQVRMPAGGREHFPKRIKYQDVIEAIERYHAPVAHHFFTGIGMNLMFRESEIMFGVLLGAMEINIPILPIHDGVLVQVSEEVPIRQLMLDIFEEQVGIRVVVQ